MKAMKSAIKLISVLVFWLQSVLGRPVKCPLMRNFLRYDSDDPETLIACVPCPKCPPGFGLMPQCGTKITQYTPIRCDACQQNETFSDKHGVEGCKSCHDCGLKNVIQQCAPSQNRKCGTECPERHYLDNKGFCQECYFCCPSVNETGRVKKCKEIGMGEDWQCLKNHQNKLCQEALENSTEASVDTTNATAVTIPDHNFKANKTESTSSDNVREPTSSPENVTLDGSRTPSIIVGMIILVALVVTFGVKRIIAIRNGSAVQYEGSLELVPLHEIRCEGREDNGETVHDNGVDEQEHSPVRQPMNNRPNIELIPTVRYDGQGDGKDCVLTNEIPEDFKLADFPYAIKDFILQLDIDSSPFQKNWKHVAHRFEISKQDIQLVEIESKKSGVSAIRLLIGKLCSFKCATLKEFVDVLQELERNDVANDIINWFRKKQDRCLEEDNGVDEQEHSPVRQPMNNRPNIELILTVRYDGQGDDKDCVLANEIPEDFKLADFPYYVEDSILQLDSDSSPIQKSWKHVAYGYGITNQAIQVLETENRKPGVSAIRLLIEKLCSSKCATLREFVDVLQELERNDVANDIISWFKKKQDRFSEEDNRVDEQEQFLLRQPMSDSPNIGLIPTGCDVSETFMLHNGNELMLHKIQDMLDPNPPLKKNWRQVGHHLNVTEGDLDLLELQYKSNGSPTESLIETLKNFTPEPSMKKFVEALISCERSDVAKYICDWPWEKRNCTELENHERPDTVQQPSREGIFLPSQPFF